MREKLKVIYVIIEVLLIAAGSYLLAKIDWHIALGVFLFVWGYGMGIKNPYRKDL